MAAVNKIPVALGSPYFKEEDYMRSFCVLYTILHIVTMSDFITLRIAAYQPT